VARVCELGDRPAGREPKSVEQLSSIDHCDRRGSNTRRAEPRDRATGCRPSIPDLITSTVKEPLAALDRAIQAKDGNQFTAAYGQLTASCNACHQSYDRTVIVIQPPTAVAAFPDQDFRPPTR
jgi:hypothetical protein